MSFSAHSGILGHDPYLLSLLCIRCHGLLSLYMPGSPSDPESYSALVFCGPWSGHDSPLPGAWPVSQSHITASFQRPLAQGTLMLFDEQWWVPPGGTAPIWLVTVLQILSLCHIPTGHPPVTGHPFQTLNRMVSSHAVVEWGVAL